jgi:hypothetical protein
MGGLTIATITSHKVNCMSEGDYANHELLELQES